MLLNIFRKKEIKPKCNHDWKKVGTKYIDIGFGISDFKKMDVIYCPKCDAEDILRPTEAQIEIEKAKVRKEYNNAT